MTGFLQHLARLPGELRDLAWQNKVLMSCTDRAGPAFAVVVAHGGNANCQDLAQQLFEKKMKHHNPKSIQPFPLAPAGVPSALWKKILLAVFVPLILFGLAETALRLADFQYTPRQKILWVPTIAGYDGTFEYRLPTVLEPPGYIWRTKPNSAYTDAEGFRLPAISKHKKPGQIRIAFLGGSTTQGQRYSFAERAIHILNAALNTDRYEVLNVGCSSYSTHQSLIALNRWVFDRDPDLVCVYHGWNDWIYSEDGYGDAEKDAFAGMAQSTRSWKQALIPRSRLIQGVARCVDALDFSWPRSRVSPRQFEGNLRAMARLCATHDKELVIFTRPPLDLDHSQPLVGFARKHLDTYGTLTDDDTQRSIHEDCVGLQRQIAETESNIRLFDASTIVAGFQQRWRSGEFGFGAQIHQPDGLHLRPLGEQLLAEQLALFLAPEQAETIHRYLASPDYALAIARQMLEELMPREATYFLDEVLAQEPGHAGVLALRDEAFSQFEFADLFWQGCWGGSDTVFESKIAKLKRCLEIRPDNFGVCMQIVFVCFQMERPGEAAEAMAGFRPANLADHYGWAWYTFQSHLAAQRLSDAISAARLCLQLDPSDVDSREFLRQADALP